MRSSAITTAGRRSAVRFMIGLAGLAAVLAGPPPAAADEVYLTDGSKVVGTIQTLRDGKLTIQTKFAGELTIKTKSIKGIAADRELMVALDSGDRISGVPAYSAEQGQRLTETAFGDVPLQDAQIVGLWDKDQQPPATAEARQEMAEMQQQHEQQVQQIKQQQQEELEQVRAQKQETIEQLIAEKEKHEDPWTFRFEAGLTGTTGNTERLSFDGRAQARREVPDERLLIFGEGHYSEQGGERSENEIRGGSSIEVDISEKFFVYGKGTLEFDEFENLDLRSRVTTGVGYFFWEEEDHELKGRAGVGYQHESFMDGTTVDQGIFELGYDYRYDFREWLRFTHSLTFFPTFDDPVGDWRAEAETAGEVPLTSEEEWKLRLGMRNEYDSMPQPGVERLDTMYFLNFVYDVK